MANTFLTKFIPKITRTLKEIKAVQKHVPVINYNLNQAGKVENPLLDILPKELQQKAFQQARQYHLNRINTVGQHKNATNAGFTEQEIPRLTEQLNNIRLIPKSEYAASRGYKVAQPTANSNIKMDVQTENHRMLDPRNNEILNGIELYNPRKTYEEVLDDFIHGMTTGLGSTAENNLSKKLIAQIASKRYPLTQRLVGYNSTLIPKQTIESIQARLGAPLTENGKKYLMDYVGKTTEQMARGYVGRRHLLGLYNKRAKEGADTSTASIMTELIPKVPNMQQLHWHGGNNDLNMYFKILGLGVPIGIGVGINNTDNQIS